MNEEKEKQYNEKQNLLFEFMGHLIYNRDKDIKLLSNTEKNRQWIEEHYNKRIELLRKIIKELED